MMTDEEKLRAAGWRLIGTRRHSAVGVTKFYDHPEHADKGMYKQQDALILQTQINRRRRQEARDAQR